MKRFLIAIVLILLLPLSRIAAVSDNGSSESLISGPEIRISVYDVPLRCPLVDGLGCGSMAKPFLTELERKPNVAEAWIDHSGTRLAVMWKANISRPARARVVEDVSKITKLSELSDGARQLALQSIRSGSGWYRANNVDELSREEAESVARRLLDIVNAAEPLSQPKRERLMTSFTEILKRKFIGCELSDKETHDELLKAARLYLGEIGIQVLDKTVRDACCASAPKNRCGWPRSRV
jgi:hypothetical protein